MVSSRAVLTYVLQRTSSSVALAVLGVLVSAALAVATSISAHAQADDPWAPVSARVNQLVTDGVAPGVGLRIEYQGETVYDQSFGTWSGDPNWSTDKVINIASSTKMASAEAIMTLVDQGKLSLSERVTRVLPWFDDHDPEKASITLGELLSHTSGLPGNQDGNGNNTEPPCLGEPDLTLEACVHEIADTPLAYSPGGGFAYGGADFQVAGLMAQVVSGESFVDFFKRTLVEPCGLNWSWNSTSNPRVAGGSSTNTASMMRILAIQRTNGSCGDQRILSPAATELMRRDYSGGLPIIYSPRTGPQSYGLGVWRDIVTRDDVATSVSSPGAFGSYPWVDLANGYTAHLSMLTRTPQGVDDAVADLRPLILRALGLPPAPNPISSDSLMAKVRRYAQLPDHLSGTPRSAKTLAWIARKLRRDGLRLHRQHYVYPRFIPTRVSLRAGTREVASRAIAPLLYSGRTGPGGVSGQLYDGGNGIFDQHAVAGKIVVVDIAYVANARGTNLDQAVEAAAAGGARGLVAVTEGVGDYPKWDDTNARTGTGGLPVLLVGKHSGAPVIAAARAGEQGRVVLQAETGRSCETDIYGTLRGSDPRRKVIVGTPASSMVPAASERGSGVAGMLGLARYYSRFPRVERSESLVFLATSGHEVGFLGLPALIRARERWFEDSDAYVHLGASIGAPTETELADGTIQTVETPDPSGSLYSSENPLLDQTIPNAFTESGVVLRQTQPHLRDPGEQAYAYHVGVPIVSFSGASLFFHTAGDLPDRVDPTLLGREVEGFRRSIDAITAMPAGALRAANGQAAAYGAAIDPDVGLPPSAVQFPRPVRKCIA